MHILPGPGAPKRDPGRPGAKMMRFLIKMMRLGALFGAVSKW